MATLVPELPSERPENFVDDLAGMGSFFIDPSGAARYVFRKWFWIGPLIVVTIVSVIAGYMLMPIVQHVLEVSPLPPNVSPEQYQRVVNVSIIVQRVTMFCAPVITAFLFAVQALILFAMCSITSVAAKFKPLWNLVAGCWLIQVLASIASVVIVRSKGDISTAAELRPALGLDIFMPEGANKFLVGFMGYFSVFQIWWMVMMVLVLSSAFRISKARALIVALPLFLLGLILRVGGAAFQR